MELPMEKFEEKEYKPGMLFRDEMSGVYFRTDEDKLYELSSQILKKTKMKSHDFVDWNKYFFRYGMSNNWFKHHGLPMRRKGV